MKSIKRSPAAKWITLSVLLAFVCSGLGLESRRAQANSTPPNKVSPALRNAQTATRVSAIIKSKLASNSTLDALLQSRMGDGIMIGDKITQAQSATITTFV
jgi:hypothetical protein